MSIRIFLCEIFFLIMGLSVSYAQINKREQPKLYYKVLSKQLLSPDSIYVYENNSSWGSGIAYFISFKTSGVKSGYYLNSNFIYRQLFPRNLMPSDSLNMYRIVYNKDADLNKLLGKIDDLQIFQLPDEASLGDTCKTAIISDGINYQLSKITPESAITKSYYEIYEYAKLCPYLIAYQKFIQLDTAFQKNFNSSAIIVKGLITEFTGLKASK